MTDPEAMEAICQTLRKRLSVLKAENGMSLASRIPAMINDDSFCAFAHSSDFVYPSRWKIIPSGSQYMNALFGGCGPAAVKGVLDHLQVHDYYRDKVEADRNDSSFGCMFDEYMERVVDMLGQKLQIKKYVVRNLGYIGKCQILEKKCRFSLPEERV